MGIGMRSGMGMGMVFEFPMTTVCEWFICFEVYSVVHIYCKVQGHALSRTAIGESALFTEKLLEKRIFFLHFV